MIRQAALNLLARRDHSAKELKQKLIQRGYQSIEIDTILNDLIQEHLLNENRFADNYINWRSNKGYGPNRILQELKARGVAADIIAQQLDFADNAWFVQIQKVWQKNFKGKRPQEFKERAKQMRFLLYRGYTEEQIASVMDQN